MDKVTIDNQQLIFQQLSDEFNIAEHLLLRNEPDTVLFIYNGERVTQRQLLSYVQAYAAYLAKINVQPEQRIIICLQDCIELIVAFLGAIYYGAIPVMVNCAAYKHDIEYIIQDSRAKLIIAEQSTLEQLAIAIDEQSILQQVVVPNRPDNFIQGLAVIKRHHTAFQSHKSDAAFWVFTSGSTGRPKAVIHAHYSIIVACEYYAKAVIKMGYNDIILSAPPMTFSYGLGTTLYMPMYCGAKAVVEPTKSVFGLMQQIAQYRVSVFFGLPSVYTNILALQQDDIAQFHSIRLCVSAGERLAETIHNRWLNKYNISIIEGIGTTETTHIFISNTIKDCKPGSSGKVVPGYSIKLVDSEGNQVPANSLGQLTITGEGMMLGYWHRLPETHYALHGNTFITKDIYSQDKDGYFYFHGRKDEMIKVNGFWLNLNEIEDYILEFDAVKEVAVMTVSDVHIDDNRTIVCFISTGDGQNQTNLTAQLKQHLKTNLPKFKIPKKIFIMNGLFKTTTGKINRNKLLEYYYSKMEVNNATCQS